MLRSSNSSHFTWVRDSVGQGFARTIAHTIHNRTVCCRIICKIETRFYSLIFYYYDTDKTIYRSHIPYIIRTMM